MEHNHHDNARMRAYQAAIADRFGFLETHFNLRPSTARPKVEAKFAEFGRDTGVGLGAVHAAVQNFLQKKDVPDFVIQAASAEKKDAYAN